MKGGRKLTDSDEKYFEKIYHSTYRDISAYVICRVKDPEYAKDILQNTYISFWNRISRGNRLPEADCARYLKTIARHEAGRHFISERKLYKTPLEELESEPISDENPEAEAADNDTIERIYREISKKDDITRKIFFLVYSVGLTLNETADALKIPLHTVRNKLYRTLAELKERFE